MIQTTIRNKFKNSSTYFLAFIIPIIILLIIYMVRDIFPFGDNCFLRSDMYHQYAPFLKEFHNKITSGGDFTYSWNIGMGVNFIALYGYYLASPLNWVVGLISGNYIIEIMSVFIIVKSGLASFTFSYYLSKHFNSKNIIIASFSIFYALSSYLAAFNWNVMWLDCIVLLPIVVLGIERLVKENKCYLYCITLAICIISNYYISIMICIFSLFYFIVTVFSTQLERNYQFYKERILHFILYSLIAGGLGAFLIIPVYYALQLTASGDFSFPENLENYFSIFKMLSRGLMDVEPAIFSAHEPNIYSSILVFLMIPLYVLNKNINMREKVGKVGLLVVFLISFNLNIPNYIWHGFHFPNSLPCRESFMFIFLVLAMSFEAFIDIRKYTNKQVYGSFFGVVGLFLLFEQFIVGEEYDFKIIYISLFFLLLYLFVIGCFRSKKSNTNLIVYILFIVIICETSINTNETAFGTTSRTNYVSDNKDIESVVSTVKNEDSNFYRIEKTVRRTKNDAAWSDYKGVSIFSSTANAGITEYLGTLGFEQSMNSYSFYGNTPLTSALLSVKYVLSNEVLEENDLLRLYTNSNSVYLYKNIYTLPLGFMIPSDFDENFNIDDSNPFMVQNNFVEACTGYTNLFTNIAVNNMGAYARFNVTETAQTYAYIYNNVETVSVDIYNSTGEIINTKTYSNLQHNYIINLGYLEEGDSVSITPQGEVESLNIYAASFHTEIFKSAFDVLNTSPFKISEYTDTSINGTVSAKYDGYLYTSIPYDEGYTVYIDGEKVKYKAFKDAFLCIPVSEGAHEVELKYSPQGLHAGSVISICCMILFLLIVGNNFLRKHHKD